MLGIVILYDDRVAELQRVAAKQTWRELFANLGIAVVLAITLLVVGWLAVSGDGTAIRGGHRCGRNCDRRSTPHYGGLCRRHALRISAIRR